MNGVQQETVQVPKFHQNLYGGTIGGPIFRDKVFAFFGYQADSSRQPQTSNNSGTSVVPTLAQRAGNFSGTTFSNNLIPGTINIPGCISNTGGNNPAAQTFAQCFATNGGILPPSAFNPVSTKLLAQYIPVPNSGSNMFSFNPTTTQLQRQFVGRLDVTPEREQPIRFRRNLPALPPK